MSLPVSVFLARRLDIRELFEQQSFAVLSVHGDRRTGQAARGLRRPRRESGRTPKAEVGNLYPPRESAGRTVRGFGRMGP